MGHRLSNKERHVSEDARSPGLQSVWGDEGEKEVWNPQQPDAAPLGVLGSGVDCRTGVRTYCGLRRPWFMLLLAASILLLLAIALGVGLGVGLNRSSSYAVSHSLCLYSPLTRNSPSNPSNAVSPVNTEYLIGGAINPRYYTRTGALNGSGIALASQSFAQDLSEGTQGSIVMYFQHHSGDIRWVQLGNDGSWTGGTVSEVVAVDAKNSTPLSAVSYSWESVNTWHIFYIDKTNTIRQRTNSNATNVWMDGPINDLNLKANDATQVGMQACWYGSDYGDSDYTHTPLPDHNGPDDFKDESREVGMHMWYASDSTTFQQLGWRAGDETWAHQGTFSNMDGHAGVGCYSWAEDSTVTYVMMVNAVNSVEFHWRDTNTNKTATQEHPINEWVKASAEIPNVNCATSLGYTNYFYVQLEDNTINGYNISWGAERTTILSDDHFLVGDELGISGTHLSVTAIPDQGGGNSLLVFYQVEGNDITEYTRDLLAGQWTSTEIEIPNS
ncbi:hypothetical protein LTR37_015509 [Vermiconidia calcicola]|uniref:Uncharacterized protein n=1 Tax=Vermiconidia calcicola TaxID=1690605 RepID=A0ACC3MRD9_9PEZI|nr:hypothetical protein LTR37_015509 [Vermiconidia calcicola]